MMLKIPWITLVLAAALLLSPPGLEFFHGAFVSGEDLTRNIARPIYFIGLAILTLLVLIEFAARLVIARRRGRRQS